MKVETNNEHRTVESIYRALVSIKANNQPHAEKHIEDAHHFANEHMNTLVHDGKHEEAAQFHKRYSPYLAEIKNQHDTVFKTKLKKSDLFKSVPDKYQKRSIYNASKAEVGNFTPNSKHEYRAFSELSPEQKRTATKWHGGRDMDDHKYPFHPETGRMLHSQRIPNRAFENKVSNQIISQHGDKLAGKDGASTQPYVRFKRPGHEYDNKIAIARNHPTDPDKLELETLDGSKRVKIEAGRHEVKPINIKMAKSMSALAKSTAKLKVLKNDKKGS